MIIESNLLQLVCRAVDVAERALSALGPPTTNNSGDRSVLRSVMTVDEPPSEDKDEIATQELHFAELPPVPLSPSPPLATTPPSPVAAVEATSPKRRGRPKVPQPLPPPPQGTVPVVVLYSEDVKLHRVPVGHPESADRIVWVMEAVEEIQKRYTARVQVRDDFHALADNNAALLAAHSPRYLARMRKRQPVDDVPLHATWRSLSQSLSLNWLSESQPASAEAEPPISEPTPVSAMLLR